MSDKFVIVEGVQYAKLSEWPTGLKTAEELSEIIGVNTGQLLKQAAAREIPHYRFDGGVPRFRTKEVKDWMLDTGRVYHHTCKTFRHDVIGYDGAFSGDIKMFLPKELQNLKGLVDLSTRLVPSGVYFLVDGEELVYIGQSVNPIARIGTHRSDSKKVFTHAFLLPIPHDQLDNVEGALIRLINPKYNSVRYGAPNGDEPDETVLDRVTA